METNMMKNNVYTLLKLSGTRFIGLGVFLLFVFFSALAQELDSLERLLSDPSLDQKERITLLDDLSWAYMNTNMKRSIAYSQDGLSLARSFGDQLMIATFDRNIGVAFYMGSVYDSAQYYLDRALTQAKQVEEDRLVAVIHVAFGNLAQAQSQYHFALNEYLQALAIFEHLSYTAALAPLYSNIAAMYQNIHHFDLALQYLHLAREQAEANADDQSLAGIYIALSDIALTQGEPMEVSMQYVKHAIRINEAIGHQPNSAISYLTLAKIYYTYDDYVAAMSAAEKGLRIAEETEFPSLIAHAYVEISNVFLHQDLFRQAVEAADRALSHETMDANITMNAHTNLAISHAHLGNPELTELHLDLYRAEVDQYATQHYQRSLSELEVLFETEKKELQIKNLERQRQYYLVLGIILVVLVLILIGYLVNLYRLALSRKRLAEAETERLKKEKQLIAVQAALDGEAAERSRLARDLHDGLGSMLSVVKFNLPQMDKGALIESLDVERFKRALGMLDHSIQELRRVAHHMMPESLLRFGLRVSLSDFCDSVPGVSFHYFGDEVRLSEKLEVLVYRCIHELVNNALKHADATQINVQLVQEEDRISFTVQDNGKGFDPERTSEGMGLTNIRQRIAAFDGDLNIYSSPAGTEVHVEFNLIGTHD